jgi:hypothetical protein
MDEFIDDDGYVDPIDKELVMRRLSEVAGKAEAVIRERKICYERVFAGKASADEVAIVKRDLARFCRADVSAFHEDPRAHAALEGRREVWLRIQQHLNMTTPELVALYTEGTT